MHGVVKGKKEDCYFLFLVSVSKTHSTVTSQICKRVQKRKSSFSTLAQCTQVKDILLDEKYESQTNP